jgi:phosphoglucomutase
VFDCVPELRGATLVIGGDGRYHNRAAIQTAIAMAAANGVARVIVGQGGIVSTPAASHLIRLHGAAGGFVFSASHNPAGPDGDFGVKFNIASGGQAGEATTDRIYARTRELSSYRISDGPRIDLDRRSSTRLDQCSVEVIDGVADYAALMQKLFDFDRMRDWLKRGGRICFDAMHAVTGPMRSAFWSSNSAHRPPVCSTPRRWRTLAAGIRTLISSTPSRWSISRTDRMHRICSPPAMATATAT